MTTSDDTVRVLREALLFSPNNVAFLQHLAETLLFMGKLESAEQEYRQALQIKPEHPQLKLGLARVFYQQGKHSQSLVIVEDLLKSAECPVEAYLLHARLLLNSGAVQQALSQYRSAIAFEPSIADREFAEIRGIGDDINAEDVVSAKVRAAAFVAAKSDEKLQRREISFQDVGMDAVKLKRPEFYKGYKGYSKAIRLNAAQASDFALLARCYFSQKLWRQALCAANQGLLIDSQNVECLNYRALGLSQLGRGKEARASARSAIVLSPENPTAYATCGWVMLVYGDSPQKAWEYFTQALQLDPNFEWARLGIVQALKAKNPIYCLMLRYFLWCSRLNNTRRWVFALVFASAGLTYLSELLWLLPIILLFTKVVADSWVANLFTPIKPQR